MPFGYGAAPHGIPATPPASCMLFPRGALTFPRPRRDSVFRNAASARGVLTVLDVPDPPSLFAVWWMYVRGVVLVSCLLVVARMCVCGIAAIAVPFVLLCVVPSLLCCVVFFVVVCPFFLCACSPLVSNFVRCRSP